jgi:hypothetical protein
MIKNILFKSDWWLHLLSGFLLWLILYLIEKKYLKRKFNSRKILVQILLSNLIDLDHIFSSPIYQAGRCSINNHLLHKIYLFPIYVLGLLTRYRYFFMGIILHLLIDYLGCL